MARDSSGNLFVSELLNNRVLMFAGGSDGDTVADKVFGQTSFTTSISSSPPTASSLLAPRGIALDVSGNLFVVDSTNNRVLMFQNAVTGDTVVDKVWGQTNLTSNTSPTPPTASSLKILLM